MSALNWNQELEKLKTLENNWDSYGSPPPNDASIELARRAATQFDKLLGKVDGVGPVADGGAICCSGKFIVECFNSGEAVIGHCPDGGKIGVWEVESDLEKEMSDRINASS